ncbi:SF II RNA helicase [Cryptosporidium sp. chipmunk genotype I]|uniref:SF II RNA helicase n=1 Tax=Cryptosporidium sp. chipmunk genotype I TaxID=1280935 RepID=UPI00351A2955|nr:SF II RNA helicase [Cryptosporidium sp. chipmunk genotype I]
MLPNNFDKNELLDDIRLKVNHNIRFSDFPLHSCLIDALLSNGFIFPSPVQYHILSQGTIEENLVLQAKSGTGKTIAFVIFILNKLLDSLDNDLKQLNLCFELKSLLIAPTREICIQINKTISTFLNSIKDIYFIHNICCIGGSPISEDFEKFHLNIPTILISTPGRFIQLMNYGSNNLFSFNKLRESLFFLLFDEADRLLEDCFIEQSKYLLELCLGSSTTQFIACSATFPIDKLQLLKRILYKININVSDEKLFKLRQIQLCSSLVTKDAKVDHLEVLNHVQDIRNTDGMYLKSRFSAPNTLESPVLKNMNFFLYDFFLNKIFQLNTLSENNYHQWAYIINSIVDILIRVPFRQSLIFTNNSSVGYKIMSALKSLNVPALYTSGKRSQIEREEIITSLHENKCRVVVCSDLLARGIDIKMIDLVINVDVPIDRETFLHRAGRSGRFGQKGIVICIPSHKRDYDSFLYFFNQLGIKFLNFSDYFKHTEKNWISFPTVCDENSNLNLVNDSSHPQSKPSPSGKVFTSLEDSDYKFLDEKSGNIDSSSTIDKIFLNYEENISNLKITTIDRNILNFWRRYIGITT